MGGNRPTQRRALALCDSNVVAEPGWSLGFCLCREFPVSPVGPPGPAVGALRTGIVASLGGDGQSRQWRTPRLCLWLWDLCSRGTHKAAFSPCQVRAV